MDSGEHVATEREALQARLNRRFAWALARYGDTMQMQGKEWKGVRATLTPEQLAEFVVNFKTDAFRTFVRQATGASNVRVEYYDLDLPADVRALKWVQLRDWDTNQVYLRFSTDRAGLAKLLGTYRLTAGALEPLRSSWSPALPREPPGSRSCPPVPAVAAEHMVNVPSDRSSRRHELDRPAPARGPLGRPSRR